MSENKTKTPLTYFVFFAGALVYFFVVAEFFAYLGSLLFMKPNTLLSYITEQGLLNLTVGLVILSVGVTAYALLPPIISYTSLVNKLVNMPKKGKEMLLLLLLVAFAFNVLLFYLTPIDTNAKFLAIFVAVVLYLVEANSIDRLLMSRNKFVLRA